MSKPTLQAQPRGVFEFTDSSGRYIKGKVGTWAMNRFCEKMRIETVTEMFTVITEGISLRALAEVLLCSVEYSYRSKEFPFTIDDAMDWVDDIGIPSVIELITSYLSEKGEKEDGAKKKQASR
jgi:hypothetical protein